MNGPSKETIDSFKHQYYAHRGLHTKSEIVPENSLKAFRLAVEKGYGIELDVQLSKDGYVMVFHDDDLERMCGVKGNIWDYTFEELRSFRLLGTDEQIPLFTEVLEILEKGTGKLICELKTGPRNTELAEKTYGFLKDYKGIYCIESFNPFIVRWFKKNAPHIVRGQLINIREKYADFNPFIAWMLSNARFSFLNKPHFVAYNLVKEPPKYVQKLAKKGTMLVSWTSRTPEEGIDADAVIFELYNPPLTY